MQQSFIATWRSELYDCEELTSSAILVGLTIAHHYREGKECYPGLERLEWLTRLSRNTVLDARRQLERCGLIRTFKKVRRGHSAKKTHYELICSTTEQMTEQMTEQSNEQSIKQSNEQSTTEPEVLELDKHEVKKKNIYTPKFLKAWEMYPKENRKGKHVALRHFRSQIKTDADYESLLKAIPAYVEDCMKNNRFLKNADTFFNQHWREFSEISSPQTCDICNGANEFNIVASDGVIVTNICDHKFAGKREQLTEIIRRQGGTLVAMATAREGKTQ